MKFLHFILTVVISLISFVSHGSPTNPSVSTSCIKLFDENNKDKEQEFIQSLEEGFTKYNQQQARYADFKSGYREYQIKQNQLAGELIKNIHTAISSVHTLKQLTIHISDFYKEYKALSIQHYNSFAKKFINDYSQLIVDFYRRYYNNQGILNARQFAIFYLDRMSIVWESKFKGLDITNYLLFARKFIDKWTPKVDQEISELEIKTAQSDIVQTTDNLLLEILSQVYGSKIKELTKMIWTKNSFSPQFIKLMDKYNHEDISAPMKKWDSLVWIGTENEDKSISLNMLSSSIMKLQEITDEYFENFYIRTPMKEVEQLIEEFSVTEEESQGLENINTHQFVTQQLIQSSDNRQDKPSSELEKNFTQAMMQFVKDAKSIMYDDNGEIVDTKFTDKVVLLKDKYDEYQTQEMEFFKQLIKEQFIIDSDIRNKLIDELVERLQYPL